MPRFQLSYEYPLSETLRTHSLMFSVICLYSILNVAFSPLAKKRRISLTATLINASGCLAYLLMGNAWAPLLLCQNAWPFLLVRSCEWCISAPLFLRMLAQLSTPHPPDLLYWQLAQLLALVLGCTLSVLASGYLAITSSLCAVTLQAYVLRQITAYLSQVKDIVGDKQDQKLVNRIQSGVFCLFLCYPIIWHLGIVTQRIQPEMETALFAWLDVTTKFIVTSVLCNLTTRMYDRNVMGCSEQFWRFIKMIELPVFAISKDRRVVYWNRGMEDLLSVDKAAVMHRRLEQLRSVFPDETRASILCIGGAERGLRRGDAACEMAFHVAGRKEETKSSAFRILANYLEEIAIPQLVFVGLPPSGASQRQTDSTAFVQLAYCLHHPDGPVLQDPVGPYSVPQEDKTE